MFTGGASRLMLTLMLLAAASAAGMRPQAQNTEPTRGAEPRVVEVVARRFAFEPAVIHATVGERLRLVVTSADGVHGIEIKQFRINREIPRGGRPVVVEFTVTEAGHFPILCSEYCGDGHDDMKGALVVSTPEAHGQSR